MTGFTRGTLLATLMATLMATLVALLAIPLAPPFLSMISVTANETQPGYRQDSIWDRIPWEAGQSARSTGDENHSMGTGSDISQEKRSETRLYRAFEPASANLDINLHKESLSLFLTFNNQAAQVISGKHPVLWATELDDISHWLDLPRRAQCQLKRKQFLAEPPGIPLPYEDQPTHHSSETSLLQVSGYIEYRCQQPEHLTFADFMGFRGIPKWKAVSVWLITDHWQTKQSLRSGRERIHFIPTPN